MLENIPNIVIYIGGLAGALVTIVGAVHIATKPLQDMAKHYNEEREMNKFCRMLTLRQAVFNTDFSLDERIEAGEKYISEGWNGYTKAYIEALKNKMENNIADEVEEE